MFLDLDDSTSIVERLGNEAYHRLLKDFLADITGPIIENSGNIYQYAGKEVVVAWDYEEGLGEEVIISSDLLSLLKTGRKYSSRLLGSVRLKGKEREILIHSPYPKKHQVPSHLKTSIARLKHWFVAPGRFNGKITIHGVISPAYCRFCTFDPIGQLIIFILSNPVGAGNVPGNFMHFRSQLTVDSNNLKYYP